MFNIFMVHIVSKSNEMSLEYRGDCETIDWIQVIIQLDPERRWCMLSRTE